MHYYVLCVRAHAAWNTTNGGGLSGSDVVTIPFYTLSARCRANILKGVPCTLYASVLGWKGMAPPSAALYSLTAAISGSFYFPVRLSEGRLDRRTVRRVRFTRLPAALGTLPLLHASFRAPAAVLSVIS